MTDVTNVFVVVAQQLAQGDVPLALSGYLGLGRLVALQKLNGGGHQFLTPITHKRRPGPLVEMFVAWISCCRVELSTHVGNPMGMPVDVR